VRNENFIRLVNRNSPRLRLRSTITEPGPCARPFFVTSTGDFFPGMTRRAKRRRFGDDIPQAHSRRCFRRSFVLRLGIATASLRNSFASNRQVQRSGRRGSPPVPWTRTHVIRQKPRSPRRRAVAMAWRPATPRPADDQHTRRMQWCQRLSSASGTSRKRVRCEQNAL